MKPTSISILALALSVAAGSAFANHQDNYDYTNDPGYYDSRDRTDYNNGNFISSHPRRDTAQVIRVERINGGYSDSGYQRQECWNEQTNGYEGGYYRDSNGSLYRGDSARHDSNVNGTIIGALIGGALGNQVGKGDGRKAATIGGAVIGGVIGNNVDRNNNNDYNDNYDQYRDNSGTIRRCRLINESGNDSRYGGGYGGGYSVTYRYAGQTYHAYTRRDPGRYIRVLVDVRPQEDGYDNRR